MGAAYARLHAASPKAVNFGVGTGVMAVGDAAVQVGVEDRELDSRRVAVCSSFNGLVSVPLAAWYGFLDRRIPGTALRPMVPKALINQAVSSVLLPCGFLTWSNGLPPLLDGLGVDAAMDAAATRLARDYAHTATASFTTWLPANTFMFLFVPQSARVLYLSTLSIAWGGYISYVAHREK
mmetsp:Transcript_4319/g.12786  ORF Transcript_4319/g.12786 Transcript_4319/m.12786 type:complete len:180 (-) Transcript_4319:24-563(-)